MKKLISLVLTVAMLFAMLPLSVFAEIDPLTYTLSSDGTYYIVSDCDTSATEVIISAEYNGMPVKEIGDRAFYDCRSITSIEIPNSVTSIGGLAFSGCGSLTGIEIPNSITAIGNYAFEYCTSITSIEIPNSVILIGESAFEYCTSIMSIEIPNSVTYIGDRVFECCTSITSIEIPNSVTYIGNAAFAFCSSLRSIEIPNSVTSIGDYAFHCCDSLTSIEIPNSVTSIGDYAFCNCDSITSIEIPNSVTSIGNIAFSYCDSLTSITVSEGNPVYYSAGNCLIETDTKTLIAGCKNSIIPNDGSITSIGDYAFRWCDSLTSIEIPNSVTSIGDYAFSYCDSLTSIEIPNSVTSIGDYAFYYCTTLRSIKIPDSVTSIGDYAFYRCESLMSIEIPNSVTSISAGALAECASITSIDIPDSVTSIGDYAFSDCSSITSIEIPNSVTSIGDYAFSDCSSITSIEIPNSVTSIGDYAFSDCSSITSIEIPNSVTSIGDSAFSGCYNLADIYCKAKSKPLGWSSKWLSGCAVTVHWGYGDSGSLGDFDNSGDSESTDSLNQEKNQYIQEHIDFVNSNKYSNLTTNASFYNSIWKHEEDSRNFTRYAAWDVIGKVGKFASLDFYGTFKTENPYDVILVDVFRSYVNNEKSKSTKVFETTSKNILGSPAVFNDLLDVLKTSEAWDAELAQDWARFTKDTQANWIQGVFFTESTFNIDDYNPELYNILKEQLSNTDKSSFEKVFKNIKNFGTISDYITSGGDIVYRFFDAYQKYHLAQSLLETNGYVLGSIETIANFQMSGENSSLLLDALDPYWEAITCDSAFVSVCDIMMEDGVISSTGNVVYTLLGKKLLQDLAYAAIHSVTGISVGALTATYNLTYMCLDYLTGLGKLSETHTLMNAAALFEKEYIELVKDKADTLVSEKTHQAAADFDTVWGFLQSLEGYCFKTLSVYISAMKREYTTNYIIKTALTQNLFFAITNKIKLSEKIAACDSAIQGAVYLESEWVNASCHNKIYSSSNLVTVKCPTDVCVYDSEGKLVLSIVDNKIVLSDDYLVAFVDGGEKIFVLPTDQEYDVEITATGNGTMDYVIKSFDEMDVLRTIRYDDVELFDGGSYNANVPSELYVEKEHYNLKTATEEQIEADFDSLEDEEKLVDISGTISCFGNDSDMVIIKLLDDTNVIDFVQTTDNSYVFEDIASGTYTLEVSKTNHITRTYEITVFDEDVVQNITIPLLCDVNGDGEIDKKDYAALKRYCFGTMKLDETQLLAADVNGDDEVNKKDYVLLKRHCFGTVEI